MTASPSDGVPGSSHRKKQNLQLVPQALQGAVMWRPMHARTPFSRRQTERTLSWNLEHSSWDLPRVPGSVLVLGPCGIPESLPPSLAQLPASIYKSSRWSRESRKMARAMGHHCKSHRPFHPSWPTASSFICTRLSIRGARKMDGSSLLGRMKKGP